MLNEKKVSLCSACGGLPVLKERIYLTDDDLPELASIYGVACNKCKRKTRSYKTIEHKNALDLAIKEWNKTQDELRLTKGDCASRESLLPCPLCGGTAILYKKGFDEYIVRVRCTCCGAQTAHHPMSGTAIKEWNTRCKGAEQEDGVEKV